MMYGYYNVPHMGIFGWPLMLIFWIALIAVGVLIIRNFMGTGGTGQSNIDPNNKEKTPMDILKERYAKGEIDKKEFDEKKKDLT